MFTINKNEISWPANNISFFFGFFQNGLFSKLPNLSHETIIIKLKLHAVWKAQTLKNKILTLSTGRDLAFLWPLT